MEPLDVVDAPAAGAPELLSDAAWRLPALAWRVGATHAALLLHVPWFVSTRWFGSDVLVLETVGRRAADRSRRRPSTCLTEATSRSSLANAGADRRPAWWLNLQAAGEGVVDGRRPSSRRPHALSARWRPCRGWLG